jgi:nickel transport protein
MLLNWLIILFLFLTCDVFAHGVEGEIKYLQDVVLVTAAYDSGEPMSYAKVEIYAPDSNIKFQLGRTDRNGRFAFVPDVSGVWQIVVSDNLGHRLELSSKVTMSSSSIKEKNGTENISSSKGFFVSREIAALLGIFMIFGLFGWIKEIKRVFS